MVLVRWELNPEPLDSIPSQLTSQPPQPLVRWKRKRVSSDRFQLWDNPKCVSHVFAAKKYSKINFLLHIYFSCRRIAEKVTLIGNLGDSMLCWHSTRDIQAICNYLPILILRKIMPWQDWNLVEPAFNIIWQNALSLKKSLKLNRYLNF